MAPRLRSPRALLRPPTGRRTVVTTFGVLLVLTFLIGGLAQVRVETGVDSFLPTGDPAVRHLEAVSSSFGGDPVVVLAESSGPRELLDQQHLATLLRLEGQLSALPDVATVYGPATTLNQIAGQTQNLLAELSGRRDGIRAQAQSQAKARGASAEEVQKAGDEAAAQFDARYGALLVQGLPAGLPTLRNPSFVNAVVYTPDGQARAQWRFVVPSDKAVAILVRPRQGLDQAATDRLVRGVQDTVAASKINASRVTVSGVPVIVSSLASRVQREVPLLGGIAVAAVAACFLLVPWAARRRRLIPLATTVVAIGLTLAVFGWFNRPLSLGVVAFLSVLLGIGSYYPTYFAQHARRRVVLVVAAGTSASFATLMLSPLPFVRDLGMTLSLGVLLAAVVGTVLIRRSGEPSDVDDPVALAVPAAVPAPRPWLRAAAGLGALVVAAAGWIALPSLPLQSDFQSFASGLPALADAQHVESVVGSSGELDIVLTGPNVLSPESVAWMRSAQDVVVSRHGDQMRPVISPPALLGFLGPSPTADQITSAVRLLPPYLTGSVLRDDGKVALLSFGVRMDDLGELQRLRDDVRAILPPPPPGFEVELTGLPMVAVRGNELVSGGRVLSNLVGIAAVGLVLAIGLRRRVDALRAVTAAVIATGTGLAGMWIMGIPLSPVTVALGSLTAAVGCEFTALLSESVRRGNRALRRSVLLATATSAIGYAVLAASQLSAIREFGVLLACSVLLALMSAACVVWLTARRDREIDDRVAASTVARPSPVGVGR
jgi:predicted RND superfamily exporter protein